MITFADFLTNVILQQKVKLIEQLFKKLDEDIKEFQEQTKLTCISGCGRCCSKPDIEATILEMLPLAHHYYTQGSAEQVIEKLIDTVSGICHQFTLSVIGLHGGMCNEYPHRGMVCRLFGFAASRDKYGKPRLVTCKPIKEEMEVNYKNTIKRMQIDLEAPCWVSYYNELQNIDYFLTKDYYPINKALILAIEHVIQYYSHKQPNGLKKAG